jgi:hypothetical protein
LVLAGGELRIDLRPVISLLPHEETIPEQLQKLTSQIKKDKVQKDPVIVDRETGTVLDGMHRLAAFAQLGLENVVCCLLDYSSTGIELKRWARVYEVKQKMLLSNALEELGFNRVVTLNEAFGAIENRSAGAAAFTQHSCRILPKSPDLSNAFKVVRSLDSLSNSLGWRRSFAREDEIDVALQGTDNMVVLVERLGKQDIVNAARSHRLFPCKTSLHTIDPRPVALDYPTEFANDSSERLREFMAKRSPKMLPAGSVYEGRRYKERLLLLDQP